LAFQLLELRIAFLNFDFAGGKSEAQFWDPYASIISFLAGCRCAITLTWLEIGCRYAILLLVAHRKVRFWVSRRQSESLFPLPNRRASGDNGIVRCKERLGGLLKYYEREAA
jgi:hypothetical protein